MHTKPFEIPVAEERVLATLQGYLEGCNSVLDVGCGVGVYTNVVKIQRKVALDAHAPYLNYAKADRTILGKAQDVLPTMANKRYDAVMCVDVIEHMEKDEGIRLLAQMQRVSARIAIVFTPYGWHPQESDSWNLGGDYWQTHRSAWTEKDFPAGWEVGLWPDFSHGKGHGAPIGALWATFRH